MTLLLFWIVENSHNKEYTSDILSNYFAFSSFFLSVS